MGAGSEYCSHTGGNRLDNLHCICGIERTSRMLEKLGKIESVNLGYEDHGILTCWLHFDFGGAGQGFGGYCLDIYDEKKGKRIGQAAGMDFIVRILEACGVDSWEELPGKIMYALYDKSLFEPIIGIKAPDFIEGGGTFLISDWQKEWFPIKD